MSTGIFVLLFVQGDSACVSVEDTKFASDLRRDRSFNAVKGVIHSVVMTKITLVND